MRMFWGICVSFVCSSLVFNLSACPSDEHAQSAVGMNISVSLFKPSISLVHFRIGPLSRKLLWIFSSNLPGNFALKNARDFW